VDQLVLILGAVFAVAGLLLFALGKARGDNRIQVAGMSLQLSHPSLLVFCLGVAMMLTHSWLESSEPDGNAEPGLDEPGAAPESDRFDEPVPGGLDPDEAAGDELPPDEAAGDELPPDEAAGDELPPDEDEDEDETDPSTDSPE